MCTSLQEQKKKVEGRGEEKTASLMSLASTRYRIYKTCFTDEMNESSSLHNEVD